MKISCVWEHNEDDTLLYAVDFPGAFTRGSSLQEAMEKMPREIMSYLWWRECGSCDKVFLDADVDALDWKIELVQDKPCDLQVSDADSDVLFDVEREPLSLAEYEQLKELVLKSSQDFHRLYESIPDKNSSAMPARKTFYGIVPVTAQEMYDHTKNVNAYYFAEIDIDADNTGTIYECRQRGFEALELTSDYLESPVIEGSYGELWSLRKVLRRFLWHDRIHAKAMYRMAKRTFGPNYVMDVFGFDR